MMSLCKRILDSSRFNPFIITVIVTAGLLVGVETFPVKVERLYTTLVVVNEIALLIFAAEVVIKMVSLFPRPWRPGPTSCTSRCLDRTCI